MCAWIDLSTPLRRPTHHLILRDARLDVVEQSRYRRLDVAAFHSLQEHGPQEFSRTVKGDGEAGEFVVEFPGCGGGE